VIGQLHDGQKSGAEIRFSSVLDSLITEVMYGITSPLL
jgi:hypothetical protein